MKNLSIILLGIFLSTGLYAHCGSCGVGAAHDKKSYQEKSHHYKKSCDSCELKSCNSCKTKRDLENKDINLTEKQKNKLKKLSVEMKKDIKKIKSKYRKNVVKLIGQDKADQYLKSMKR